MALRFLQLSDTHLGRPLGGLPDHIAAGLNDAVREVVREAFAAVREQGLQLVLMPGDLFEQDGDNPAAQLRFIYEQAALIAPVPVVIAPGNHDAIGPESPYSAIAPPENVVLFSDGRLRAVETRAGWIVGRGIQAAEQPDGVDWTQLPSPPPLPGILTLHASVLHAEDGRYHRHTIVPTTLDQLVNCGYRYIALGHYHKYREFLRPGSTSVLGAYAGCPQGLGWDEPGPKGYLIGTLGEGGAEIEFIPAARHVWQQRELKLPPEHAADAYERLAALISSLHAELESTDLLALSVYGRWPEAGREGLSGHIAALTRGVWHARAVDWSGVEYTPALVPRGQSEALDLLLSRCDEGIAAGGRDAESWELAHYLGHRLLSGKGLPEEVAG